jgi:hypothetical protein
MMMGRMMRIRREMSARQKELDAKAPKVGDIAPDFELQDVNGENPVRLSDYRNEKPVALVFGSFT